VKEITYILGAGASYQSMPIFKNFASRFNEFIISLKLILNDYNIVIESKEDLFK
jgi:hypothetical protein